MARNVNRKCQHCAMLAVEDAIALHGPMGDDCWNPGNARKLGYDCYRRRNHYRHRDDDNRTRRRMRKLVKQGSTADLHPPVEPVEILVPSPPPIYAAVLVLYRNHPDAPVHAVAAEIWQGSQQVGEMKAVHCMGMRGDQVAAYLQSLLQHLREHYGVGRFEDVVKEVPVTQCPIEGCPLAATGTP
ncbi:MAG: hypothetical protein ACFE0J_06755 [Elainellaceae cyanobacterium]